MNSSWINYIIIALSLAIGYGAYFITKKPNSTVEQVAETILSANGINIDFSNDKQKDCKCQ